MLPPLSHDPYFDDLARHANARIPVMSGVCEEEMGPYMALGDVRRFFFATACTAEGRVQVLNFLTHSLETGGEDTETAIVLEVFTEAYYGNEPFTSLVYEHLSPTAWALFLTHREIERHRGIYTVTAEGQSRPYAE